MPEMSWYGGRFARNIRIDAPIDGGESFDPHAHVFDESGTELLVVNRDGTARHGSRGRLHPQDAELLAALGYRISADLWVRWSGGDAGTIPRAAR
jgi:hypothetical protein